LKKEECDEIFTFLEDYLPDWEKLVINYKIKIKTNQEKVQFRLIVTVLEKFNLRIIDVSFTNYYGIVFGIEKIKN